MDPSLSLFRELLSPHPRVVLREMDPSIGPDADALLPEEHSLIARAVEKRRKEFTAGRLMARDALAELGLPAGPLLRGEDRVPLWPQGIVGSITHTRGYCAVAVAREQDVVAIGLDIEQSAPLKPSLLDAITAPEDRRWLAEQGDARLRLAKQIFSAKECAYKAQYRLTRQYLGFGAMSVRIDELAGTWRATFLQDAGEAFRVGDILDGRVVERNGLVATSVVITR